MEAVWVPQSIWCDPTRHSLRAVPSLPGGGLFPSIDLNGVPVWGFTYRLATDWLGLLPKQVPIEHAGFEVANRVLDFLLSFGLKLKSHWEDRVARIGATPRQTVKVATVEGSIPVELVTARFSTPQKSVPRINLLEILPDNIRVVGLAFEEYLISSTS